jgi:hypothetical protein
MKKAQPIPLWVPVIIGIGLVLFPEPATTLTGLGILGATFSYKVIS